MFQVLDSRLGARLAHSPLLCPGFAFRSLLRPPILRSKPFAFGPDSGYSRTISEPVITQRTMTAGADVGASPTWEDMWSGGLKKGDKWDMGIVSPALTHLLNSGVLPKGRAFVPGCGRGYEAIAFGKSGSDAIGLDLAPTGIEEAKKVLEQEEEAPSGKVEFIAGDFFGFKASEHGKFDVILDYTFLCALDPTVREAWADHMVSLLKPDGELVTLIFPIVEKEDGPPYALSESLVSGLLEPRGLKAVRLEMLPPELCHKGREGKTALGRWRFFSTSD